MPEIEAHSSDLLHLSRSFGDFSVEAARLADDVIRSAEAEARRAADALRSAQAALRGAEEELRAALRDAERTGNGAAVAAARRRVDEGRQTLDRVGRAQRRVAEAAKAVQLAARSFRQEMSRVVPEARGVLNQLAEDALTYERAR